MYIGWLIEKAAKFYCKIANKMPDLKTRPGRWLLLPACLYTCLFLIAGLNAQPTEWPWSKLVDPQATPATRALYANLQNLSGKKIIFGHQDALAYGVNWKNWHKRRSDVHDVSGKHPALVGWEFSKLGKYPHNIDSVDFAQMQGWIRQVYRMGGINEISWHFDNFVNGLSSWDVGDNVVAAILPGGVYHEAYRDKLDRFADYIHATRTGFFKKKDIPIVLRLFHEHTGAWFWWGQPHCTPEEYKTLWQFTVHYLRDVKNMHNILYCYSPDVFRDKAHYLECYPGDDYVDILGFDDYHDLGTNGHTEDLLRRLRMLVELADEKGKIAALTETGQEGIKDPEWWTQKLLEPIKSDPVASRIAWIMVWRNARPNHHYGPYPGHAGVPDFLKFSQDPRMLFQDKLPNLYKWKH